MALSGLSADNLPVKRLQLEVLEEGKHSIEKGLSAVPHGIPADV